MSALIHSLIHVLKVQTTVVETRAAPASGDYFEAVVLREQLPQCLARLSEALGPPVKGFGKTVAFEPDLRKLVETIGGIRADQCLFVRRLEQGQVAYAALWPWASDPAQVTLKVGVYGGGGHR